MAAPRSWSGHPDDDCPTIQEQRRRRPASLRRCPAVPPHRALGGSSRMPPCVTTVLGPRPILGNSVTHSQTFRPGRYARSGHHSHRATGHVAVHHRKTEQARAPSCSKPNAPRRKKKQSRDTRRTAENCRERFRRSVFSKQKSCSQRVKDILLQYLDIKVQR